MKVGIYNGPEAAVIGGTEFCAAVLAEHLGRDHDIEIIHEKPSMELEALERAYGAPLPRTTIRKLPPFPHFSHQSRSVWQHFARERAHTDPWSKDFDLFIAFTHRIPPFCAARRGILISLFPFGDAPSKWGRAGDPLRVRLRERIHHHFWKRRMESYQICVAISEYSREWTERRWKVKSGLLHPPCNTDFSRVAKQPRILSVGRFTVLKSQLDLLEAYEKLKKQAPESWEYRSVGPLGTDPVNVAYFKEVQAKANRTGAKVFTELTRKNLTEEFQLAALFWHGAGYKENPDPRPEYAEHFGITTVEAMAAGCVPLVINRGGQPELVRHGVDGFVWNTPGELVEFTTKLQSDPALVKRMSESARERARAYSKETFLATFDRLLATTFGL